MLTEQHLTQAAALARQHKDPEPGYVFLHDAIAAHLGWKPDEAARAKESYARDRAITRALNDAEPPKRGNGGEHSARLVEALTKHRTALQSVWTELRRECKRVRHAESARELERWTPAWEAVMAEIAKHERRSSNSQRLYLEKLRKGTEKSIIARAPEVLLNIRSANERMRQAWLGEDRLAAYEVPMAHLFSNFHDYLTVMAKRRHRTPRPS